MKGKRAAEFDAAVAAGTFMPLRGRCVKCGRNDIYLVWVHTPQRKAMIAACLDRNACARAAWTRRAKARGSKPEGSSDE